MSQTTLSNQITCVCCGYKVMEYWSSIKLSVHTQTRVRRLTGLVRMPEISRSFGSPKQLLGLLVCAYLMSATARVYGLKPEEFTDGGGPDMFALGPTNVFKRSLKRKRYQCAVHAIQSRCWNRALDEFEKLVRLYPRDDVAYQGCALCYLRLRRYDDGIASAMQAVRINPRNSYAYVVLGWINDENERYQQALQWFDKANAVNETEAAAFDGRAYVYEKVGKYELAFKQSSTAIRIAPSWPLPYFTRAVAFAKLGDLKGEIEDYRTCLQKNPPRILQITVLYNLTARMGDCGKYEESRMYANQALVLSPNSPNLLLNRGASYAGSGQFERALADFRKVEHMKCSNSTLSLILGNEANIYNKQQKYAEALDCANRAILADPGNWMAFLERGFVFYKQGNAEEAIKNYDRALSLNPNRKSIYKNRGDVFLHAGDFEQAIADLAKAQNQGREAHRSPSLQSKQLSATISNLTQLICLDQTNSDLYYDRAVSFYLAGELPKSLADFRHYLSTCDRCASAALYASLFLNIVERKLGKTPQAKAELEARMNQCKCRSWPYPIVQYFRGRLSSEALFKSTRSFDQLTTAKYFRGIDLSVRGTTAEALKELQWVTRYGNQSQDEYELAECELQKLNTTNARDRH